MYQHFLDEKRRELVVLQENREKAIKSVQELDISFIAEKQFVSKAPEKAFTFTSYIKLFKEKRAKIVKQVKELEAEIDALSDQITEAFGEMKKYEILRDKKIAAEEAEMRHKTQVNLDEMAGVSYQRKQETN